MAVVRKSRVTMHRQVLLMGYTHLTRAEEEEKKRWTADKWSREKLKFVFNLGIKVLGFKETMKRHSILHIY